MEIVSFGETCLRLRGKEGIVATDAFPRIVGPTGRGLTADIVTYSHEDGQQSLGLAGNGNSSGTAKRKAAKTTASECRPVSRPAFLLDSPGEFEVHHVLINGVQTYRDETRMARERGSNVCFRLRAGRRAVAHLGDIGHLLNQSQVSDFGDVDVVCVSIGGSLAASRAAEIVTQLDAKNDRADAPSMARAARANSTGSCTR